MNAVGDQVTRTGIAGRVARAFINSRLTPIIVITTIALGAFGALLTPREEEPQIIVPMIDIFVQMPGASAEEVEQRVATPMEKLLWEIPGVEYVYSTTSPGMAMAVVRFYVGQNEEQSIVRLNQKMQANFDLIPPGASQPLVKPRSIDDVPILAMTFWSRGYSDFELRRIVAGTFTVKAAREMRNRVREEIQHYLAGPALPPAERRLWQEVDAGLDAARIGTSHGVEADEAEVLGAKDVVEGLLDTEGHGTARILDLALGGGNRCFRGPLLGVDPAAEVQGLGDRHVEVPGEG